MKIYRLIHTNDIVIAVALMILLLTAGSSWAQETKTVHILNADKSTFNRAEDENLRKFIGNVAFEIDSTILYCDTAYLNDKNKNIDAYGNIHIKVSDTLNIYGDILNYQGRTRIADIFGDVELVDNTTTLTTDHLVYDRNDAVASYTTGGEIVDSVNRLTSIKGFYKTEIKEFTFYDSVRVFNPDYTMRSDTLMYNTGSKVSYFYGPSWIESEENTLYAEYGWYNTISEVTRLQKKAFINNGAQTLRGDSLFYNRNTGFGTARRNVWMRDKEQNMIITGEYAEYDEQRFFAYVTDSARAVLIDERDSLFVSGDTLYATFDTTNKLQNVFAYFGARFFHHDLQGAADSLKYAAEDSVITMFKNPAIWAQESQITADTITITLNGTEVEYMELFHKSLIASYDTLDWYNQIKGRYMKAFFKNNSLYKIETTGNAESIYYVKDEMDELKGVNKSVSGSLTIYFEDNKFSWITFVEEPNSVMYPLRDMSEKDRFFPDFEWQKARKPKNKDDVF
jgi:lipopolysaccharide export system protein LptA